MLKLWIARATSVRMCVPEVVLTHTHMAASLASTAEAYSSGLQSGMHAPYVVCDVPRGCGKKIKPCMPSADITYTY
jgi:hypothetical protein